MFFLDWNMSDALHNSAASSWVCVTGHVMQLEFGIKAKEFQFKPKNLNFIFHVGDQPIRVAHYVLTPLDSFLDSKTSDASPEPQ